MVQLNYKGGEIMCQLGDKVIHVNGGVFVVEEIKIMNYGYGDVKYICLKPYFIDTVNKTLTIYVAYDKKDEMIRPIMSKQDALQVIEKIKNIQPIWYQESKVRKEKFAELLNSHDIDNICVIVKSLYTKQLELQENNKSLNLMDYDYLRKLKKGIEEELAISLNVPIDEIGDIITKCIE